MKNLFKSIYDSEINLQFSWFWDAGYDVKIGDELNGFKAEFSSKDIDEVILWIKSKVIELYPNSKTAKNSNKKLDEIIENINKKNNKPYTMKYKEDRSF